MSIQVRIALSFLMVSSLLSSALVTTSEGFILSSRWGSTATNGGGLGTGDPTTVTWSLVPDGTLTEEGPSDLISFFDTIYGAGSGGSDLTQRPWFPTVNAAFERWDEVSGVTYTYEPNDDGIAQSSGQGVLGVRGDARVGGAFIDGNGSVLAFNFFPDNGDMVLDTGDTNFYSNPAGDFIRLRNVIMHEAGHGLGYSHIESNNADFLMEPFINTGFDGPQFDELRGIHRGYGDALEENGGNDTIGNAFSLGNSNGNTLIIGSDARDVARVNPSDTDFVSIDDDGDFDYYSFSVNGPGTVDITLEPKGPTYNQGAQGGSQSSFNTKATSNLTLQLYDSNQSLVQNVNNTGAGQSEQINGFSLTQGGTYFVRVSGSANSVQLYTLDVTATLVGVDGDFNDDGAYSCLDVDGLVAVIAGGSNDPAFDLTGDGVVNGDDLDSWLAEAGSVNLPSGNPYLPADANLDGVVDGVDFSVWNDNKFTSNAAWCKGDHNADGVVDGVDFSIWNDNKFTSSDSANAVPEPGSLLVWGLLLTGLAGRRRRGIS